MKIKKCEVCGKKCHLKGYHTHMKMHERKGEIPFSKEYFKIDLPKENYKKICKSLLLTLMDLVE